MMSSVRENSIFVAFVYLIISIQLSFCHAECEIPKKDIYSSDVTVFCDGECLSFCVPISHWMKNEQKYYNCTFSLITSNIKQLTLIAGSNPNLNVEMLTCNLTTASVLKVIEDIGLKPNQRLSLNGAKLTESDALDGFEKINDLRLINMLMDDALDENMFEKFKQLTKLDLRNNSIDTLPENIFQHQTKLRSLNLADNNLTSLPMELFDNLQTLIALDLSGNALEINDLEALNNLTGLEILNLSRNELDEVASDLLESFNELQSLNLAGNRLTSLPDTIFSNLSKLERLDVSGNELKHIQSDLFNDLENLIVLNMSNNQLDSNSFDGTQSPFKNLTKLTELNLSNNNLQTLNIDDLSEYLNETTFWLKGNPWECDCDSEAFRFLQRIFVQDFEDTKCANNMTIDEQVVNCENRNESITGFYIFMLLFIIGMVVIVGVVFSCDKYDQRLNNKNSME